MNLISSMVEREFNEFCQATFRKEGQKIKDKMEMNQIIVKYLAENSSYESQRAKNIYDIMIFHVKEYIAKLVLEFKKLHGDQETLEFFYNQYQSFMEIIKSLNVMSYPIRKTVKSQWKKPQIIKSAKLIFERRFEDNSYLIYHNIVNLMLRSINEQNQEQYEEWKTLINKVGSLIIELHIVNHKILHDTKPTDSKFKLYLLENFQQLFKQKFIQLKGQSVIQYLREVQQLKERLSGLISFKAEDILSPLQKQLFQELLANYKYILLDQNKEDSFYVLIEQKNKEGLQLVAQLFENLDDHYDKITLAFKTIVLKKGCKILQAYEGKEMDLNLQSQLIDQLSQCHLEYQDLINTNFTSQKQSSDFLIALNNAFEEILDIKIDNYEIPSFLVNLINENLEKKDNKRKKVQKKQKQQKLKQFEPKNDQLKLMKLFMFIGNKERFFELYQNSLSERIIKFSRKGLIEQMITDEENQLRAIEERCGNQQSESLRNMLQDLTLRFEHDQGFLLNPIILSIQHWPKLPTNEYQLDNQRIIEERAKLELLFNQAKKKIQWIDDFSTLEVYDHFTDMTYFMTIPQYILLNQFNLNQKLSLNQIKSQTNLEQEVVQENLTILLAYNLIQIENDIYFAVNQVVKQKKGKGKKQKEPIYLQIAFPQRQITKNLGQLNMDQAVEAQIVKVMKMRKIMKYQDLVDEVKFNMRKFHIDQNLIKQLIERLSKNEYLERDPQDMNVFKFK